MTKTRIACAVTGLVCLVAAALLAWLITPDWVARAPGGRVDHRSYEGTFQTLLDPAALAQGNLLGAVKSQVPMSVEQTVKVEKTSGDKALISDTRTTSAAGNKVEQTRWEYAVDRYSLEAVGSHPADWNVVAAQGLTVSWPLGAEKKTYQGWTPETRTTTPLTYLRSEKKQGISTYVYEAKVAPTKIVDDQILSTLPKTLPRNVLKLVGLSGSVPAAQAAQLAQLLPQLPDPVPLAYAFQDDSTFWIDPSTGLVIDVQRAQQRVAEIALPGGPAVPLLPAVVASYHATAASSAKAADDARHDRAVIRWAGVYLPIILLVLGAVLLALAVALSVMMRGRRPRSVAAEEVPPGSS
ncbi:MAG: porin PorA family protein [Catenulispora sp.]